MSRMRPFRFGLFLGLLGTTLAAAGYLWAPLVRPVSPSLHLSAPVLQSTVVPVKITAAKLPSLAPRRLVPVRVTGSFLLHVQLPVPHEVSLHVAARVAAATPFKPSARPVVERPVLQPSIPAAMPAPTAVPALPEPVIHPATPTPEVPIPLPLAPQPVAPATPPAPNPAPAVPQPVVPVAPSAPEPAPSPVQPVVPVTPPAPSPAPVPTPVSEPPPPPTTPTPPPTPGPPPGPTPAATVTRPGNGYGDQNHCHTGPPGKSGAASTC